MQKNIFTLLFILMCSFITTQKSNAQCLANFAVWPDTTLGAPLHTYLGNNTCVGANFMGIDTINYTYTWTWGDGTATTAPFPSHTYAAAGNYTICLFMSPLNPAGCSDSMCIVATINKNVAFYTINIINPFVATTTKEVTENKINIYPNPTNDKLYIYGLDVTDATTSIYAIDGRLISTEKLNSNFISVSNLKPGNYMLKITSSDNKSTMMKFTRE